MQKKTWFPQARDKTTNRRVCVAARTHVHVIVYNFHDYHVLVLHVCDTLMFRHLHSHACFTRFKRRSSAIACSRAYDPET